MSKWILVLLLIFSLAVPVSAQEWTAPQPPDPAMDLMPEDTDTFWEGAREIILEALPQVLPSLSECLGICAGAFAVVLLLSVLQTLPGNSKYVANLAGSAAIGILLVRPANSLIGLGVDTVRSVSEYGKLLLPVMAAALAGGGGTTTSAALYTGTIFFDAVLGSVITAVLVPLVYVFVCLGVAKAALGEDTMKKLSDFVKWLMTWCLKLVLYVFTGYISVTGVISGTADATAVKAAKITISGMVPVVGGILSDASEAVLVSTDLVRNAAGIYGLFAVLAICIRPFLQIGIQYLLLKATGALCTVFESNSAVSLIHDFTWAMGLILAMTGTGSLILLVSIVCFMRGVG